MDPFGNSQTVKLREVSLKWFSDLSAHSQCCYWSEGVSRITSAVWLGTWTQNPSQAIWEFSKNHGSSPSKHFCTLFTHLYIYIFYIQMTSSLNKTATREAVTTIFFRSFLQWLLPGPGPGPGEKLEELLLAHNFRPFTPSTSLSLEAVDSSSWRLN